MIVVVQMDGIYIYIYVYKGFDDSVSINRE